MLSSLPRAKNPSHFRERRAEHQSQERNRSEALDRLRSLILTVTVVVLPRKLRTPSQGQHRRRLEEKKHRSATKESRKIVE